MSKRAVAAALASALVVGVGLVGEAASGARADSVLLGVFGSRDHFAARTGTRPAVGHGVLAWRQGVDFGARLETLLATLGPVPMVGLTTERDGLERITPLAIARGAGDDYLAALSRSLHAWGRLVYVRPFAEMNGHWNAYSAFTRSGTPKGHTHSTAAFRKAFARVYTILHGGNVDRRLRRLGLPPLGQVLPVNPKTWLRVIWNPQGAGSPDLPGNAPAAYYPGDAHVDVVGNDIYNLGGRAAWDANERLYQAHPGKPFAIPEWANWSLDDPVFVRRMAEFVRTHRRVELVAWYNGRPGSVWDIGRQPRSLAAYRRHVAPLGS